MKNNGRSRVGSWQARRSGIASALDIYGSTRSFPEMRAAIGALADRLGKGPKTDQTKLTQDWRKVGSNIQTAYNKVNPVNG